MAVAQLEEIVASLKGLPVAAVVTDLKTYEVVAANDAASSLVGMALDDLVGRSVLSRISPSDRAGLRAAYEALVERGVDGYQVERSILTSDGNELKVLIWGRRVEYQGRVCGLWFFVPVGDKSTVGEWFGQPSAVVLAVTDHDWQIQYMSADADLLGSSGSELRGFPLIGLIHPSVATEFLAAAGRVASQDMSVTVLTRMRVGTDRWEDRYCLLARMCEHSPPRIGAVISAGVSRSGGRFADLLDEELHHCATESRAAAALSALPGLALLPQGSELSARQTEIVAHLVAGESVPDIASLMYLSASTVRNHLAAIYRKFGVHSQSELLAALLRAAVAHHE